jgi:hypothetical protein
VALGDTAVLFARVVQIEKSLIPASSYQEYARFMKDIVNADKAQIVVVRKPN